MKKILFLTIILPTLLFSQIQNKVNISADIRGHACAGGFGLCSKSEIAEKSGSTFFAQKTSENSVVLTFDIASLSKLNQESIAGKEFSKITANEKFDFIQTTDITINAQTLLQLGFDRKNSVVKSGKYPMKINSNNVEVSFTLSEAN